MLTSRYAVDCSTYSLSPNTSHRNADVPRALVRDMYTKSWSAFDRLVSVVPPGGSIGFVSTVLLVSSLIYTSFPVWMTSCSVFGYFRATATRYRMSKESSALRRA